MWHGATLEEKRQKVDGVGEVETAVSVDVPVSYNFAALEDPHGVRPDC